MLADGVGANGKTACGGSLSATGGIAVLLDSLIEMILAQKHGGSLLSQDDFDGEKLRRLN
jgi:hypothetical protein